MLRTLRRSLWYRPVIPRLRGLRQEDNEFQASLGYIVETLSQKQKRKKDLQ
jgi:hypothetical protein